MPEEWKKRGSVSCIQRDERDLFMKLSEILYERVRDLWKETAKKPFVTEMAEGSLDPERFRTYMLQDYLYLLDYIDILQKMLRLAEEPDLKDFLGNIIEETQKETDRVHLPSMRRIGICDEEIADSKRIEAVAAYVEYMRRLPEEEGLLAGLTALLQCSWIYAYIGQVMMENYAETMEGSPYKSWFDAYTCREYLETNQRWIDFVDEKAQGIDSEGTEKLCQIFEHCATCENHLWDVLYEKGTFDYN